MCQNVTGIVVNNKPRVDKEYTRKIRQEMYYIEKLGVEQHLRNMKPARFVTAKRVLKVNYMKSLLGRINYALFINPNDSEMGKYKYSVTEWLKRNSSYDDGLKEKRDDDLFSFYLDENLPF
jgi:RNA-directed DNA polymerase